MGVSEGPVDRAGDHCSDVLLCHNALPHCLISMLFKCQVNISLVLCCSSVSDVFN